ncbi:MAG TPA: sugar transferase [Pseudobacteroides sp.]|nr:sugar transferase [Pseudobacteroides sp.]
MIDFKCFDIKQENITAYASKSYVIFKRIFDIAVSFLGLILIFPLLLFFMAYLSYRQYGLIFTYKEAIGFGGRVFRIYRFYNRSENDEKIMKYLESNLNQCEPEMNERYERKLTAIERMACGEFITKALQLINVIKGEMSIVGPLAINSSEVKHNKKWFDVRLTAKPGILGLWDLYKRKCDGYDEMIWFDFKYLRERGLIYDVKIVLKVLTLKIMNHIKR